MLIRLIERILEETNISALKGSEGLFKMSVCGGLA